MSIRQLEDLGGSYTLRSGDLCLVWRPTIGTCDFGSAPVGTCYQRLAVYLGRTPAETSKKKCRSGQRFLLPRHVLLSMFEASGAKGIWYDTVSGLGWQDMHLVRHPVYLDYEKFINEKPTVNKNICLQVSPFTETLEKTNFGKMLTRFPEKDGTLSQNCAWEQDPEYWTLRGCLKCMNVNNPSAVCEFNDYDAFFHNRWEQEVLERLKAEGQVTSPPEDASVVEHQYDYDLPSGAAESSEDGSGTRTSTTTSRLPAALRRWREDYLSGNLRQSIDPVLVYRQYEGKSGKITFQMKWRECVARQLWAAVVRDLQHIERWQGWRDTYIQSPQTGSWKFRHVSFGFHGYEKGLGFMTAIQGKNINDIAIYGLAPLLENLSHSLGVANPEEQRQLAKIQANPALLLKRRESAHSPKPIDPYKRGWYRLQALGSKDLQSPYRFRFESVRPGRPVFSFVQSDRSDGTRMLDSWQYILGDTVDVSRGIVVDVGALNPNTTLSLLYGDQLNGPSPAKPTIRLCEPPASVVLGASDDPPANVPVQQFDRYAILRPRLVPLALSYDLRERVKVCAYNTGRSSCLASDYRSGIVVTSTPLRIQTNEWGLLEPWHFCGTDFVMKEATFLQRMAPLPEPEAKRLKQAVDLAELRRSGQGAEVTRTGQRERPQQPPAPLEVARQDQLCAPCDDGEEALPPLLSAYYKAFKEKHASLPSQDERDKFLAEGDFGNST
eukprot:g13832.t1